MALQKGFANLLKDKEYQTSIENSKKSSGNTIKKMYGKTFDDPDTIVKKKSWNLICDRHENHFEFEPERDRSLQNQIVEFGLTHPITIVKISTYLEFNDISESARAYYEKALADGFQYYVISGHRRSRAIMSLCCGESIGLDKTEFYNWYKQEFFREENGELVELSNTEKEEKNQWSVVDCVEYKPKSAKDEEVFTQMENLSARQVQTFTWVYNSWKLLKTNNEKVTGVTITQYVNDKYAVELSPNYISKMLTIITTFDDNRFIEAIFSGLMTPHDAKNLVPYYKRNLLTTISGSEKLRNELLNKLSQLSTNEKTALIKELADNKKATVKAKPVLISKEQVIEIAKNCETINELIEKIQEL